MKRVLFVLCVLAAGCSAITDTGRHTSGESVSPERFCLELAEVFCAANEDCCDVPAPMCRTAAVAQCDAVDDVLLDPITGYDARAAGEYLALGRMASSTCDTAARELFEPRNYLSAFLDGTVAEGGTCTPRSIVPVDIASFVSCERGLTCRAESLTLYTCQQPGGEGAECTSALQCREDLTCVGVVGTMAGTCGTPYPNGTACTYDAECATLHCNPTTSVCEVSTVDSVYCTGGSD